MSGGLHPARGVALVLAAAALWGTTGTAQSVAHAGLASAWVGALRLVVSALFFVVLLAATARRDGTRFTVLPWPGIVLAAACMTAYNLAFFAGVRATGVAVGTAIGIGSGPVWAGLLQAVVRRAPPPGTWWAGTLLAVAGGTAMVAGRGGPAQADALGIGLCLLAGLAYAVYALVSKTLVARAAAAPVTGAVFTLAALFALPIAVALAGVPRLVAIDVVVVAWLGVMSTGIAYLLFAHGLRHVSGATGVALALAEPCVAFALAVAIVGERPGVVALGGLLGVLAGLGIVIRSELRAVAQ